MHLVPLFIDGKPSEAKSTFSVTNPQTGKVAWEASAADIEHAEAVVQAAQHAFTSWSKTKPHVRRDLLLRAASLFKERSEQLKACMIEETGAQEAFVDFNITATHAQIMDVAGRISSIQGSFPTVENEGRSAIVLKEPYGVVFGIAPWNAPYILGCRAFLYAIATGNTVVLKGSELSPRCYHHLVDVFQTAGLPNGCLNLLFTAQPQDSARVAECIIARPEVGKINFTGSTAVGRAIATVAAKHLKPVLMELGGKATTIVLRDADLKKAANGCALGAFLHSGQVCMGTERIAVHASIEAEFQQALKEAIDTTYAKQPGNLISAESADRVRKLAQGAITNGARLVHGSVERRTTDAPSSMHPIVVQNVAPSMDLHYAESFGPVVSLYTFETEDEALNIANDTQYGLAGAIYTENLAAGLRLAKAYTTGAVHINSMTIHDETALPHGGVKSSGFGRFNGDAGLNEFLRTKVVTWED